MKRVVKFVLASLIVVTACAGSVLADWPDDPSVNLLLSDMETAYWDPKVETTSDGGAFVLFYSDSSGNHDVYLQRVDANGNPLWDDGKLISDNDTQSSLYVWDFEVDVNDNAIIVTNDFRFNGNYAWDLCAYSVSTDGTFNWNDGYVAITDDPYANVTQKIAATADGGVAIAWTIYGPSPAMVVIQKLNADGTTAWGPDTLQAETNIERSDLVPTEDGGVILQYIYRASTSTYAASYLHAQRYSATGAKLWGDDGVVVEPNSGIARSTYPVGIPDGANGAIFAWPATVLGAYHVYAQHVDANGNLVWNNGERIAVSTSATELQSLPTLAYDQNSGDAFIYYLTANLTQSLFGIGGQKVDASGAVQWSDTGKVIYEKVAGQYSSLKAHSLDDGGCMISMMHYTDATANDSWLKVTRLDSDGNEVWENSPVIASNTTGRRLYLTSDITPEDEVIMGWVEERGDHPCLYMQNVNPDGTLGNYVPLNPAITIDEPADEASVNLLPLDISCSLVDFNLAASEGDGLIQVIVTGTAERDSFTTAASSFEITSLEEGENEIFVQLVDYSGEALNPAAADTITVTYNMPTLQITAPTNDSVVDEDHVTVHYSIENFTLGASGDGNLMVTLNDGQAQVVTTEDTVLVTGLATGANTIKLELVDSESASLDPEISATVSVNYVYDYVGEISQLPTEYAISGAWPNPFNPSTRIQYAMKATGTVRLAVYDVLGRQAAVLVDGVKEAGYHNVSWHAENMSSGIYFVRMSAEGFVSTHKLVRLK